MPVASEQEARQAGENAALALRHRLGLGADAADLDAIAERLGVLVVRHPFGENGLDGMYTWDGRTGIIGVNTSLRPGRRRFTLAHELGHHELHRFRGPQELADANVSSDRAAGGGKDPDEVAANSFAAHLLLPREGLLATVGDARNSRVGPEQVVALVARYRVSWEMSCWRLNNEGVIRPADRKRLLGPGVGRTATLAQHGINTSEHGNGPALPARFVSSAVKLWQDWCLSDERLAQVLETDVDGALRLMADWEIVRLDRAEAGAERGAAALVAAGVSAEDILGDLELDDDEDDDF